MKLPQVENDCSIKQNSIHSLKMAECGQRLPFGPLSVSLSFSLFHIHTYTHKYTHTTPLPPFHSRLNKCNGAEVKLENTNSPFGVILSGLCVRSRLLKLKLWDSSNLFHTDGKFTKYSLGLGPASLESLGLSLSRALPDQEDISASTATWKQHGEAMLQSEHSQVLS